MVLPATGDHLLFASPESITPMWVRCTGRRFDFTLVEPTLHYYLDLG